MAISAMQAAKRLCERSGWTLSNLELQKQLYIAHMRHLGETGEPLIRESFEAWDYGPVQPILYQRAKAFGADAVGNVFHDVAEPPEGSAEAKTLDATLDALKNASPGRLVAITHWEEGAWAKHYRQGDRGVVIPKSDILQEYQDRMNEARKRKRSA